MCIHCKERERYKTSVYCQPCTMAGRKAMFEVAQTPWWEWAPYRLANIEGYVAQVVRLMAKSPDPELTVKAANLKVNLPPRASSSVVRAPHS